MEQRVQMIPNIAAIYRRNKIVEEKFIQGRPHLYNIFGRCLFISSYGAELFWINDIIALNICAWMWIYFTDYFTVHFPLFWLA